MKALFFFACALACIFFISADTIVSKLKQHTEKKGKDFVDVCLDENGLTAEGHLKIEDVNNTHTESNNIEELRKIGCTIECLLRKLNWMEGSELKEERMYNDVTEALQNDTLLAKAQSLVRDCSPEVKQASEENCLKGVTALTCTIVHLTMSELENIFESLSSEETETKTGE